MEIPRTLKEYYAKLLGVDRREVHPDIFPVIDLLSGKKVIADVQKRLRTMDAATLNRLYPDAVNEAQGLMTADELAAYLKKMAPDEVTSMTRTMAAAISAGLQFGHKQGMQFPGKVYYKPDMVATLCYIEQSTDHPDFNDTLLITDHAMTTFVTLAAVEKLRRQRDIKIPPEETIMYRVVEAGYEETIHADQAKAPARKARIEAEEKLCYTAAALAAHGFTYEGADVPVVIREVLQRAIPAHPHLKDWFYDYDPIEKDATRQTDADKNELLAISAALQQRCAQRLKG